MLCISSHYAFKCRSLWIAKASGIITMTRKTISLVWYHRCDCLSMENLFRPVKHAEQVHSPESCYYMNLISSGQKLLRRPILATDMIPPYFFWVISIKKNGHEELHSDFSSSCGISKMIAWWSLRKRVLGLIAAITPAMVNGWFKIYLCCILITGIN